MSNFTTAIIINDGKHTEINLGSICENLWHIHAVYQRLVEGGQINPSTDEDYFQNYAFRSLSGDELNKLTEMAIEFDKNWGEDGTGFYSNVYAPDYDDAIQAFAEERLKELFGCRSANSKIDYVIEQIDRILSADQRGAKIFTEGEGGVYAIESLNKVSSIIIDLRKDINKGDRK